MKLNWTVRARNPWFWVSLAGVALTAMGAEPETLTSWGRLWAAVVELIRSPYLLGSVALAVLGVFLDPTTEGLRDSSQALTYKKPKGE